MRITDIDQPDISIALPPYRVGRYDLTASTQAIEELTAREVPSETPLATSRVESTWLVALNGAQTVEVSYRVRSQPLDQRTIHVDQDHAFISPSSVFLYIQGRRSEPLAVTIDAPERWEVASPMSVGELGYLAQSYDDLIDCPMEAGLLKRYRISVEGVPHEIVVSPPNGSFDASFFTQQYEFIVPQLIRLFGQPAYDQYLLILHVYPDIYGGTEYKNSAVVQIPSQMAVDIGRDSYAAAATSSLIVHELVHAWNGRWFRPRDLRPNDFESGGRSSLLWFVEGVTDYIAVMTLLRTGMLDPEAVLTTLGTRSAQADILERNLKLSASQASLHVWDGPSVPTFVYRQGLRLAFTMDLLLRETGGDDVAIDDVLRILMERFPPNGPGYTEDDLITVCSEVSGSSFRAFFDQYVSQQNTVPLADVLAHIGLRLQVADEEFLCLDENGDVGLVMHGDAECAGVKGPLMLLVPVDVPSLAQIAALRRWSGWEVDLK